MAQGASHGGGAVATWLPLNEGGEVELAPEVRSAIMEILRSGHARPSGVVKKGDQDTISDKFGVIRLPNLPDLDSRPGDGDE